MLRGCGFVPLREMHEHTLETASTVCGRDRLRRAVRDDAPMCQEHDSLTYLLDVAHVVAGHQQRRAVLTRELEQPRPDSLRDIGVE